MIGIFPFLFVLSWLDHARRGESIETVEDANARKNIAFFLLLFRCAHSRWAVATHSQQDEINIKMNGLLINVYVGRQRKIYMKMKCAHSWSGQSEFPNNRATSARAFVTGKMWKMTLFLFYGESVTATAAPISKEMKTVFFSSTSGSRILCFLCCRWRTSAHFKLLLLWLWDYELWLNKKRNALCVCVCITRSEWLKRRWNEEDIRSHCYGIQASFNHGRRSAWPTTARTQIQTILKVEYFPL